MSKTKFWKHGPFQGTCTKPKCKKPAKHRLFDTSPEWGDDRKVSLKSLCQKHWLRRLEKIKLKKAKKK